MLLNSSRNALAQITGFLLLTLACCGTAWAYDDYGGAAIPAMGTSAAASMSPTTTAPAGEPTS